MKECKTKIKIQAVPEVAPLATEVLHQFSESLGTAIDAKDPHTSRHSLEVAEISQAIAAALGLPPMETDLIHVAGHLHDIGKIGVPDRILCKQGPLDDLDWQLIRKHPDMGADILRPVAALAHSGIVDMVRFHHERFDGRGYPKGLKGVQIPLGARIICLADTLSAILQNRPYRPARDFDLAVDEIRSCAGTQFDPRIVMVFMDLREEIRTMLGELSGKTAGAA